MLLDHEMELTDDGGETIIDDARGQKPLDLQTTSRDVAIGEPLDVFMQILGANCGALTSIDVSLMNDTDGAGGSEVTLVTKNFLLAALTTALGVRRVGRVAPGLITLQFLTAKWVVNGANNNTAAKMKIFLQKATDNAPANDGRTI